MNNLTPQELDLCRQLIDRTAPLTGDEARQLRILSGLRRSRMADMIGVNRGTIAAWEASKVLSRSTDIIVRGTIAYRLKRSEWLSTFIQAPLMEKC